MKAFGIAVLAAGMALPLLAIDARAADPAERYRERLYERPVPRVYYQPVRPALVCRVAFLRDRDGDWPKEHRRVARCADLR